MTVVRAFLIILGTASAFGVGGATIGFLLGTLAPGYYSATMRMPLANEAAIGVGLGLTQGLVAGLVVGCIIVLAVAIAARRSISLSGDARPAAAWTSPPRSELGPSAVQTGPRSV
jgi:hypothetical protein